VVGTIAPTVRPIADAAKDSAVTIPQNFPNLKCQIISYNEIEIINYNN
jgi:hypothetical protein